mmetsp:Transcript_36096/g.82905  ORF Transcript_36096/g.82905 Transcript_36096/m.82905 type:complete len:444 (-) Transcript_36096:83-1414(-)
MAAEERVRRVRTCLQIELPSCHFEEEVIERFATVLEDEEALSLERLVQDWEPFLISSNACMNSEDASSWCERLLRRLQEQCVDGIDNPADAQRLPQDIQNWLENAGLTHYAEETREWCKKNSKTNLVEMLEVWQELRDALQMKKIEIKRFENYARPQAEGAFGPPADRNRYMINLKEEVLGKGGFAEVRKCKRGNDVYAVKIVDLRKTDAKQRTMIMAEREVKILQELRHEKIVSFIEMIEEPGAKLYMVMEYMPLGDLLQMICQYKVFKDALSRSIFLQVVDGLKFMHEKKVIHRDLKPENILVKEILDSGDLLVKLTDFGHSKPIDGSVGQHTVGQGTPQYMAPEVSQRKGKYDYAVDLWSLGVLLFVMLHGVYPFEKPPKGEEVPLCFECHRLKATAKEEAQDLIRALVVREPSRRLSLAKCEAHAWCLSSGASPARLAR